jgi:membrane protease subunit (stomatin/prohibitin family)
MCDIIRLRASLNIKTCKFNSKGVISMGIIKAALGAVSGGLADQWLEVIEPASMDTNTIMCKGVQVSNKRSSNTKGTSNIISNGSTIHVGTNQMMLLVDGGKVVDYSAEEGYYTVNLSSSPSMFNGELKSAVKDTFSRIKYGGQPSQSQQVYYINLQELTGIKFGTKSPLNYWDEFYQSELFLRCFGTYSIKVVDPLKFFSEVAPKNKDVVLVSDINTQFLDEFMCALQSAMAQMSVDGIRISAVASKGRELSKYMAQALDEDWNNLRGIEVVSVGIGSINYDDESKKLINMRNQGAMMSNPNVSAGYMNSSIAQGIQSAGANTSGAVNGFMGMNMAMNTSGAFVQNMPQAQAQPQQQPQSQPQQSAPQQSANSWTCKCGATNSGKFCMECGSPKPAPANEWICSCGAKNTGKFCMECGSKKPEDSGEWTCSCGAKNTGKFCMECGAKRG